jgi:hypothetical protein
MEYGMRCDVSALKQFGGIRCRLAHHKSKGLYVRLSRNKMLRREFGPKREGLHKVLLG